MGRVARQLSHFESSEVKDILKRGKRVLTSPTANILLCPTAQELGRILVITPKRIGKAAKRNRVRRRLKAIFFEETFYDRGYDCVVFIKKDGIDTPFDELKAMLTAAFAKV